MENEKFIIWSIEHNAWWMADQCGYTKIRDKAGTYSYQEACEIIEGANKYSEDKPNEAMIKI